jgi:hypothetical protein
MIQFHLPHTNIKFKVVPYLRNRKHKPVYVEQNQVILYYDEKFDAVALTPRFSGYQEVDERSEVSLDDRDYRMRR